MNAGRRLVLLRNLMLAADEYWDKHQAPPSDWRQLIGVAMEYGGRMVPRPSEQEYAELGRTMVRPALCEEPVA